jgi:hypothetical protein
MKDVLACLYNSQPSLIAATQAFAAKRMEIGSIFYSCELCGNFLVVHRDSDNTFEASASSVV